MAEDLINSLINRPNAQKEIKETIVDLELLQKQLADTANSALTLNNVLGKSTTSKDLTANITSVNTELDKSVKLREKLRTTIISNSEAEVAAYEKSKKGEDGITSAVNKRNIAEGKAAAEATASSAKTLAQQEAQAKQYIRTQGILEGLKEKLIAYKAIQAETSNPQTLELYNKKIQDVQVAIRQLSNVGKEGFDSMGNAVAKSGNLFQSAAQKVVTLARILPGIGVAGLIAFATGPIIDYISTLDIFAKKTDTASENLKNFNEISKNASKEYGEQSTKLEILYKAATDVNNSQRARLESAKALQKEFPETFGNLTKEAILNGEAADAYDKTTDAIIVNAKARAASNKISELAGKIFEADVLNQKIEIANTNQRIKLEQDAFNKTVDAFKFEQKRRGLSTVLTKEQIENLKKVSDASVVYGKYEKDVEAQKAKDKNAILKQSLQDQIALIKQVAGGNNVIADAIDGSDKPKKTPKTDNSFKDRLDIIKANEQEVLNSEKSTLDERLAAIDKFEKDSEAVIALGVKAKVFRVAEGQAMTKDIENEANKQRISANEDAYKKLLEGEKQALDERERQLNAYIDELEKTEKSAEADEVKRNSQRLIGLARDRSKELELLSDKYSKGLISQQEYNDKREKIDQQYNLDVIDAAIALATSIRDIHKKYNLSTDKDDEDLAKLQIQRDNLVTDVKIKNNDKLGNSHKELNAKIKELADDAAEFVITLVDAGFERRKNQLQDEANAVDANTQAQIDAVDRSVGSEQQKADKIAIINAKANADKKRIANEQKRLDIEKAKFDKAVALARIIENTAVGITAALTSIPPNVPLAFVIGAIGAIQLATAIAQPIPTYKDGTESHKGGWAIFGEAGTEYVKEPGKKGYLTQGATLAPLPAGTQVISNAELMNAMANPTGSGSYISNQLDLSAMIQESRQSTKQIVKALELKQSANYKIGVRDGKKFGEYLKRNLN